MIGTAYYRVKQIDKDGRSTNSNILTLYNKEAYQTNIYPNSTQGVISISIESGLLNKTAVITDLSGKVFQNIKLTSLSFTLSLDGYPAGTYLFKAENKPPVKIFKM